MAVYLTNILTQPTQSVKLDSMNIEKLQELTWRADRHAALSDVMRLAVVDELSVGDRSPGELQAALGLSSSLLAHHLKVLQCSGIVARSRSEGDRRRTYLTLSDRTVVETVATVAEVGRVLFVCTANSARSQLAAAIWGEATDVPVASAGTQPAAEVAAGARAVADRHGLTLPTLAPRHFESVAVDRDLVVAVCDNAYEELGNVIDIHWSVPDPLRSGEDRDFELAFDDLRQRVLNLAPLVHT